MSSNTTEQAATANGKTTRRKPSPPAEAEVDLDVVFRQPDRHLEEIRTLAEAPPEDWSRPDKEIMGHRGPEVSTRTRAQLLVLARAHDLTLPRALAVAVDAAYAAADTDVTIETPNEKRARLLGGGRS